MKSKENVCAKGYRIFLVILLAAVIGGGFWYCYSSYQNSGLPEDGTLVKNFCDKCSGLWA